MFKIKFSGRVTRKDYLFIVFISMLISFFIRYFNLSFLFSESGGVFSIVQLLILAYIFYMPILGFSYVSRRLHDLGHSAWVGLVLFVPIINFLFSLYLIFAKGELDDNMYGPSPYRVHKVDTSDINSNNYDIPNTNINQSDDVHLPLPQVETNGTPVTHSKPTPLFSGISIAVIIVLFIWALFATNSANSISDENNILSKLNSQYITQNKDLSNKYNEAKYKADFLDEKIAIVVEGGKNYHTIDCPLLISPYTFWAYNIEAARDRGYGRCVQCH